MNIWKILTRVWDPFGELPTKDEWKIRDNYEAICQKVHALEIALQSGGDVGKDLQKAKQDLSDTIQKLPRGHTPGFIALCFWFIGTLIPLVFAYLQLQSVFLEIWHSPDNWYLQRFRPVTAYMWQFWQIFISSPWSVTIPILILILVWTKQRKLPRWQARTFIKIVVSVETLFIVVSAVSVINLRSLPLISVSP
jgi:hypothetical protein